MGVGDEVAGEVDHRCERGVGIGGHGHLRARDDVAVEREDGAEEGLAARQVETDDAVPVTIEIDEDRGLSGPRGLPHALLGDEAVGDEARDEIGDRHPREARLPREVGATHGAAVEEGLQDERAVVPPRVLGQHLRTGAGGTGADESAGGGGVLEGGGIRREGGATTQVRSRHVC